MSDDLTTKYFLVKLVVGPPTEMSDFDFNDFDDPEEIQKVISEKYGSTDKSELAEKIYNSLGISTFGELDDPENLQHVSWDAAQVSKNVSVDPFSFKLEFIISADVNPKISGSPDIIENEILHCIELDGQLPEHNVTLNYFESHEVIEISREEYDKLYEREPGVV